MSDPTKPIIDYSYTGFQLGNQASPFPGTQLDNDLRKLANGVGDVADAIKDIRRSDGALQNGIVTKESLASDVLLGAAADGDQIIAQFQAYCDARLPPPSGTPYISVIRDAAEAASSISNILAGTELRQGVCVDEVNRKIYTLHITGTSPEVSWIAQYNLGRNILQSPIATSNSSAQIGHQGISLEYTDTGAVKLWSSIRQSSTYPNGHRQVMRFNFNGDGADISGVEVYTLFGPEFSFSTNNAMPSVSYDQRFLVAAGRTTSTGFTIRVFDLAALVAGGPGDYSGAFLYQWTLKTDILASDAGGNGTPVQGLACDGEKIYVLAGNSTLQGKKIHAYTIKGERISVNNNVKTGITQATAEGTYFEPEGICIFKPAGALVPVIGLLIVTGPGSSHKNYLWALGAAGIQSGKWVPSYSNVTNTTASVFGTCHFMKIGDEVTIGGRFTAQATTAGTMMEIQVAPPFPSQFVSVVDAGGVIGCTVTPSTGAIEPNTTTKNLAFRINPVDTTNRPYYFTAIYQIF